MTAPDAGTAVGAPRPGIPAGRSRARGRGLRRWLLRLLAVAAALALASVAAVAALWPLTPSVGDAARRVAAIDASHGTRPAPLPVPDRVGQAVVATENSRFYADPGLDPVSVLRAGWATVIGSPDVGAATLEQQLAKNIYPDGAVRLWSKIREVELGIKLAAAYPKATILRLYLDAVYFGHGLWGVAAAARGYFGVAPGQLSWGQASLLAGLVLAPTTYDPYRHPRLARERQRHVLDRLVATGVLTAAAAREAAAAPLRLR